MSSTRIDAAALSNPANIMALGAGVGLAPKAPGTFGTLLGIPILLLMPENLWAYALVLLALFVLGVWCCGKCAKNLQVHDHPGIVWDEIVGYLITMMAVPRSALWIVVGFALFRVFDILKPWPIGWIDRHIQGGLGIMLDDVLAAIFALIAVQIALAYFAG